MEKDQAVIDFNGQEIPLGSDFKVGPVTSGELFRTALQSLGFLEDSLTTHFYRFLGDLKSGNTTALVTLVTTLGLGLWLLYLIWYNLFEPEAAPVPAEEPKEPIVLRDFTTEQLREFDGTNGKPTYIGLGGDVFDVSAATEYYGVDAAYHCFAGRNSTRAMAKFSFEESELGNNDLSDLSPFEKSTLEDWIQKFKYFKCYPIVGKYSFPDTTLNISKEQLAEYNGSQPVLAGRVNTQVFVALKSQIYDVSYGGYELYGKDGPYNCFAGKDASRALAKMSFLPEDVNSSDLADLTQQNLQTLDEWIQKFEKVKKYPVVGQLNAPQ